MKQLMPVIIVFLVLVIAGAFFITSNNSTANKPSAEQQQTIERAAIGDVKLTVGNPSASATIVEYFDYKCPSCNNFHRNTGKQLTEEYIDTNQAKFEVRITPVIGPDSANAGRGAYCANDQGLFEPYHNAVLDYMYDNYYSSGNIAAEFDNILTTNELATIVQPLGIDSNSFSECVDSDRFNPLLDENLLLAADDEIQGTPGFAIGEQSFVGAQPFSVFKTLIDIELR